jgi:hypothetical protein
MLRIGGKLNASEVVCWRYSRIKKTPPLRWE